MTNLTVKLNNYNIIWDSQVKNLGDRTPAGQQGSAIAYDKCIVYKNAKMILLPKLDEMKCTHNATNENERHPIG